MEIIIENGTIDINYMDDDHLDGFDLSIQSTPASFTLWADSQPIDERTTSLITPETKTVSSLLFLGRNDAQALRDALTKLLDENPPCLGCNRPGCTVATNRKVGYHKL